MPFVSATNGQFGYGRGISTGSGIPFEQLNTIAVYLRNYMTDFRNPNFYVYRLDGTGVYIDDGGSDMYDTGNFTTPWLRSGAQYTGLNSNPVLYPFAINYTNTTRTLIDTDFYYISLGYIQFAATQTSTFHPLTVIGTRSSVGQPIGWQIGGDSGADGGGTLASGILYAGSVINGFTCHAFYRETYNAGDPSHCNLFILLGHPNWDSTFGTISSFAATTGSGSCGCFFYTSGANVKNIVAIQTLLSKASGVQVTAAECQAVVQNFITRIKQATGF